MCDATLMSVGGIFRIEIFGIEIEATAKMPVARSIWLEQLQ
jgi:hypothetical protein